MTSILNSVAANTALLNLENTISGLNTVQSQISTGLKVQSAADNAAYFSISSVLSSDSNALSTVSDSLNLGNSSLSVASNALSQIQTRLSDIKSLLLEAAQPNANMATIQQSISQDQAQLQNIATSANFNGQNFLSVNSSAANYNPTLSFVSSYSRNSTGQISIGYINIDTQGSALFDSGTAVDKSAASTMTGTTASIADTATGADTNITATGTTTFDTQIYNPTTATYGALTSGTTTLAAGVNTIQFATQDASNTANQYINNVSVNIASLQTGGGTVTITHGAATATLAAGDTVGGIAQGGAGSAALGVTGPTYDATSGTYSFYVVNNSDSKAGEYEYDKVSIAGVNLASNNGFLDSVDLNSQGSYTDANGNTTNTAPGGTGVSLANIDISKLTNSATDLAKLNAYQTQVDAAIQNVASAASTLGTAQSRIMTQSSFISSLQTSINNGVGTMVDADMNLASTKLQALQVQQQLGIQSLSIANQSQQAILKLFQ